MKNHKISGRILAIALLVAMIIPLMPVTSVLASTVADSETLAGWTLQEGYSVTSQWVYEGSYALEHTGSESLAVSDKILLEEGVTYYVSAAARPQDEASQVKIEFAGQTLQFDNKGRWEELSVIVLGDGSEESVTVTASGTAQIDGIKIRPFKEGDNLLGGGDMSSATVPFGGGQWLEEFEGAKGVLKQPASGGVLRGSKDIAVENGEYYLVSIDVYMEENPPWAYIDMDDRAGEVQLRGTKTGEWHNVSAVWQADTTSVPLRLIVENNWDNPVSGATGTGAVYFDNVSIKKVTLYDDLIADEGFEATVEGESNFEWVTVNTTDPSVTADSSTNKSSYEDPSRPGCPVYVGNDSMNIQQWAEFKFTGTQFTIIGGCSLDCTAVDIYIDGSDTPVARADLAKNPWQTAEIYRSEELENKEHTVRLVPALRGEIVTFPEGTQYGYSFTRTYCGIDAFTYKRERSADAPQIIPWAYGENASHQSGSHFLFGYYGLKLNGNATAIANNDGIIEVEPNCYYYYSAWRLRPGDKNTEGVISIKTADGNETLASITGSRYNQIMWNPAEGTNNAEKQTAHWEQIYGFWFSGDNTQVKICAESEGSGAIYFDNVTFNKFENRAAQNNIFENGDMEGYIPDAIDLLPTDLEKARVKEQYESFLANDLASFPTSFVIDGKQYNGFGEDFTLTSKEETDVIREAAGGKVGVKTTSKLTHTSGLVFTVESVLYEAYNAYDWTLYATQPANSAGNSPVISNWKAIDYNWEGELPRLTGTIGDHSAYQPYTNYVEGALSKTSGAGRGTQGDSSYFNFQYGDKGIMMAVGWPGYWTLNLNNSENPDITRMTAGQTELNTYLAPGETIRTPLMAFVHYNGRNADRCTNLWRAWMIDCNVNTITPDAEGTQPEVLPDAGIYAATSIQWHEMTRATTENQITAISYYLDHNVDLTYWWMDAGWYYKLDSNGNFQTLNDWGWTDTGVWVADDQRFGCKHDGKPHGALYDISEYAEENGIRTLLWFEPERIANKGMLVDDATDRVSYSDNTTINPNWVLDGGAWPIMDMGNKDAVNWMLNRILTVMKDGGIDMYREDFNTDPLPNWQAADKNKDSSGNRKGITENLYVQGHLGMWDSILEAVPNATIDSCASGGNRNDLESMRRGVPLHKTDHAYGDQTWQQNSAAYFQKWVPYLGTKANGEVEVNDNTTTANRYSLRTALVGGMVLGYNTDAENAPVDWDIIEDITEEHKDIMHLLYSDYYVHEDWSSSGTDWSAWQYFDQDLQEGYLIAFRRENASAARTYYLKGLDKDTEYKIWFEDANKPVVRTGIDLMKNGVEFTVPVAMGSDILHIQKASQADADRNLSAIISEASFNGQYQGGILDINGINLSKYDSSNGERALYSALKDNNSGYARFDIHFNMNLRDTVLNNGTLEENVEKDYASLISIDGKKVSALNSENEGTVYMDYDAFNNILNVYVKREMLSAADNHTVQLSSSLKADGGAALAGTVPFTYSGLTGKWEMGDIIENLDYPETLTATQDTSSVSLKWAKVEGAEGYKVYRYNASTGQYTLIKTTDKLTYTVTGLSAGTNYRFAVRAYKTLEDGSELLSLRKILKTATDPVHPSSLTATQDTSSITLKWSKVNGATGYKVYRYNATTGQYILIKTTNKLTYTVTGLKAGTNYRYAVRAYKTLADGSELLSLRKILKTGTEPVHPSKVSVTSRSTSSIKISWPKVTGAEGYRVYIYNSSTGTYKTYKTTTATSCNITGLKSGTKYRIGVRAYSETAEGTKLFGLRKVLNTSTKPLAPFINSVTSPSKGKVTLKWSNVSGESGYQIYYSAKSNGTYKKLDSTGVNDVSETIKGLQSGKTYYFKVRAYKTVNDTKVYGSFSSVKGIKIK